MLVVRLGVERVPLVLLLLLGRVQLLHLRQSLLQLLAPLVLQRGEVGLARYGRLLALLRPDADALRLGDDVLRLDDHLLLPRPQRPDVAAIFDFAGWNTTRMN